MPNVSFFIPAYNCAATIAEAVESIMATNFTAGDELIITNDCSTDNTAEVILALQAKYPAIKIFTHKRNKGGAAARNTSVENSGNDLLFCLDADNVLTANSINPLKEYLLAMQADVASFQYQHFFIEDKLQPNYIWHLPEGLFDTELYYNGGNTPGQHGNYLFTKQSWVNALGYAEGSGALDTYTFGLRQAITGARAVILKDTHYYHRLDHQNSYWMRDAEANLWSVSVKATHALNPFFDRIDEKYLIYMLGSGRYTWFYHRGKKPIKIIAPGAKREFYHQLHLRIQNAIYPKQGIIIRGVNKLKRMLKYGGR
ncbi:glycosyltransferase family 2 protein [Mucilaginibacter antarcticus]